MIMVSVIEKQYMEAVIRMGKRLQSGEIDWEQRRYEIAKDIVCAYCMSVGVGNSSEATEKAEIINASVEMADMLLARLEKKE